MQLMNEYIKFPLVTELVKVKKGCCNRCLHEIECGK